MRRRVIVVGVCVCVCASACACTCVCLSVCLSVNRFSRELCLLWVPNVEIWTSTMGALCSVQQETGAILATEGRFPAATECALIRDRHCLGAHCSSICLGETTATASRHLLQLYMP